ncbi:hypothetical protein [Paraburkholderia phytofirmans]|uniref:Tail fiber protein n=1 Tax=Paraburkholderia phytofirmans TaxID=261302 RepID=A0ABW9BV91_9BURK
MFRIDDANAATSLPAPEAPGTEGYWSEGNPATGVPATNVRGSWLNMIQEELCSILAAAGITRAKTSYNQVNSALQKMYTPAIGAARNVSAFLGTTGPSATFNADEIVVKTALGGQSYMLGAFSKAVSLSASGIGGVVGTAPAANGYAAIYAAVGLVAGAGIFVTDATAAKAPEVASVALPSGYTASALIGIVPMGTTTANFAPFVLTDRKVDWGGANILTNSTVVGSGTARASASIPFNARFISGFNQCGSSAASAISQVLAPSTISAAGGSFNTYNSSASGSQAVPFRIAVVTPQTIYQTSSNSAGTPQFTIGMNSYEF